MEDEHLGGHGQGEGQERQETHAYAAKLTDQG
jgi:hypothetical protein